MENYTISHCVICSTAVEDLRLEKNKGETLDWDCVLREEKLWKWILPFVSPAAVCVVLCGFSFQKTKRVGLISNGGNAATTTDNGSIETVEYNNSKKAFGKWKKQKKKGMICLVPITYSIILWLRNSVHCVIELNWREMPYISFIFFFVFRGLLRYNRPVYGGRPPTIQRYRVLYQIK